MEIEITSQEIEKIKKMQHKAIGIPIALSVFLSLTNFLLVVALSLYAWIFICLLVEIAIIIISYFIYRFIINDYKHDIKSGIVQSVNENIIGKETNFYTETSIEAGSQPLILILYYSLFPKMLEKKRKYYLMTNNFKVNVDKEIYEISNIGDEVFVHITERSKYVLGVELLRKK